MDRNRRLAELLGIIEGDENLCQCGISREQHSFETHPFTPFQLPPILDFTADPRLVLEVMQDKELLEEFMFWYSKGQSVGWVRTDHILDRTGKLAEMAIEWMEGRGK